MRPKTLLVVQTDNVFGIYKKIINIKERRNKMEIVRQVFALIFYILFFLWAIFKIKNILIVKKYSNKNNYIEIKQNSKKDKISKILFKITIMFFIIIGIYLGLGIILGTIVLFLVFITLFGTMYVDTGTDSTFFYNFIDFSKIYFSPIKYVLYISYLIIFIILIRLIYIEVLNYKELKKYFYK